MKQLVIVGAGGLGRGTAALLEAINAAEPGSWELIGFVDDAATLRGGVVQGLPICGSVDWLAQQHGLYYVLAVGASRVRRRVGERLAGALPRAASLIHPSVNVHSTTQVGPGAIIRQGAALAVSVTLGRHVILNFNTTVGHDARLGDYATAHPGAHLSGAVRIEEAVELGAGSVVLPGVSVGAGAVIGAGAVVNEDLPAHCTAVGVPARPIVR